MSARVRVPVGLAQALPAHPKLLLTATPLQNSLMELYGLCGIADDRVLGDVQAFRSRYMVRGPDLGDLRQRLLPVMHRTLRRDVLASVPHTERHALTQRFRASPPERRLYDEVSDFLARHGLVSLPAAQRGLKTMVLRKLLASSYGAHLSSVEALKGRGAWLRLERIRITGFADEEHLLFSRITADGGSLEPEAAERMFRVGARDAAGEGQRPAVTPRRRSRRASAGRPPPRQPRVRRLRRSSPLPAAASTSPRPGPAGWR
jgi:hypothetical protein